MEQLLGQIVIAVEVSSFSLKKKSDEIFAKTSSVTFPMTNEILMSNKLPTLHLYVYTLLFCC